eukprot:810194_1
MVYCREMFRTERKMMSMKAAVLTDQKDPETGRCMVKVLDRPVPTLSPNKPEALVKISHAALNRRDYWMTVGMYQRIRYGSVMGADGCGTVVSVSRDCDSGWRGRRVILYTGEFKVFGDAPKGGTLAEYLKVDTEALFDIPEHLTDAQAASIPLAGLTAYRAVVVMGKVKKGDRVLIPGIGGGVALFALQFALALGAHVTVTSSKMANIKLARQLGAEDGLIYTDPKFKHNLRVLARGKSKSPFKGFDTVVDGGGGDSISAYIDCLKMDGKLVSYGATAGPVVKLNIPKLFLKRIQFLGTAMGTRAHFSDMLALIRAHRIIPVVDSVRSLCGIGEHFRTFHASAQFGKLVVKVDGEGTHCGGDDRVVKSKL